MKLPAAAIAVLFLTGIVLGLHPLIARHATSHGLLVGFFLGAGFFLFAGIALTRLGHLKTAASAVICSWLTLGVLSSYIAQQPLPRDHVLSRIAARSLELNTPLRWHGKLRDEPARLPWGYSYEIELSSVEFEGNILAAHGGLRLGFTPKPNDSYIPEAHAGDEIAVLTQAKLPPIYKDEGAFDRRAYLAGQNIHLVATLRAPELLERVAPSSGSIATHIARIRRRLREEVDSLFPSAPQFSGILRAMLLGDRGFIDRTESADFQKTGVFHVLVVAGLHVGALAVFLFWLGRRLRLPHSWAMLLMLLFLFSYVAVVEQRPPVLRAALMAAIVVIGGVFYRRLDLLNSAAIAATFLLIAHPLAVLDTNFQLSFLAIFCIAGVALPWLDKSIQPYLRALRGWRDVTRDVSHEPRQIQFRIDLRSLCAWFSSHLPLRLAQPAENFFIGGLGVSLRIVELIALTFVLQIGMLPLMARDFHRIPLIGPLANLFAVPLTTAIVPLGFFTVGMGLFSSFFGKLLAVPLSWLLWLLMHLVQWFASFPRGSYRIPGPPLWLILAFFGAAVFLAAVLRSQSLTGKWLKRVALSLLAVGAILITTFPFSPRRAPGQVELTVLDVGQGDSLFVVSPKGHTMLIDGGGAFQGFPGHEEHLSPDPGEDAVSPYLWSRGFRRLDVVALTHAHQDHLGGLTAILENFSVGSLWLGHEVASPALAKLEQIAHEKRIPIEHETKGKHFFWDGAEGVFLWPEISPEEVAPSIKNNDSLVFRLQYGNRRFMLPGDAEKQTEFSILGENDESALNADVLKIGHHGSKNSTVPEFLSAVHPSIALISAGEDNPYGHPSPELLERLRKAGARILRTDRDGALHVLTDGKRIEVSCFIACPTPAETGMTASEAESGHSQTPNNDQHSQQQ